MDRVKAHTPYKGEKDFLDLRLLIVRAIPDKCRNVYFISVVRPRLEIIIGAGVFLATR